ncbi:hypothetical protein CA54_24400 [Symmachiella macrocystis]|uniref:Uncharacterized protein n=1 Tax=Symmachiella macrocystis TaxID=2527985 RepID=A0A5C6BNL0_9PLAN|nr:hypothetical protein CA54_24400 [Symmachiella macrocystis]
MLETVARWRGPTRAGSPFETANTGSVPTAAHMGWATQSIAKERSQTGDSERGDSPENTGEASGTPILK